MYCHDIIKNIKCMIMVTLDVGLEVLARKAFEKYTCWDLVAYYLITCDELNVNWDVIYPTKFGVRR
jgi:hypothetical protein